MKKYLAEAVGSCVLVLLGCGTTMLVGCDAASGGGYILTALAFGSSSSVPWLAPRWLLSPTRRWRNKRIPEYAYPP